MTPESMHPTSNSSVQPKSPEILAANPTNVEASFESNSTWKAQMRAAIRSGRDLCAELDLEWEELSKRAEQDFPVFAPLPYIRRMRSGDPADPLLRQVLSSAAEVNDSGVADPVGDGDSTRIPGLLQKYQGRVLLIVSGACAVHCRYCFRREFPYSDVPKGRQGMHAWLDYLHSAKDVEEVILSGGDPLSISDDVLSWFVESLDAVPHLRRLRIHTRFPVVIPERICEELLTWVERSRLAVFFVLHFNHTRELDLQVARSLQGLRSAGATLLNQSVLLRGVNDSVDSQSDLCLKLLDHQVIPYYLHQLDPVKGAMHFGVTDENARQIVNEMRRRLPGYGVPKLVREIPGEPHKTPL